MFEIAGLRWIRDILSENIVLATNKVLFGNPEETKFSRTFITSEYSERQVYLEGFSSTNLPDMEFVMERLSQLRDYYNGVPGSVEVLRELYATKHVIGVVSWFEFDSKVTDNQKLAVLVQKASA